MSKFEVGDIIQNKHNPVSKRIILKIYKSKYEIKVSKTTYGSHINITQSYIDYNYKLSLKSVLKKL